MHRAHRAPAVVISALFVIAFLALPLGCGSSRPPSTNTFEAPMDGSGVQHVKIVTHSFYFEPDRISVRVGHPVELEIHNHSLMVPHNFTVSDENLSISQGVGMFKGSHTVRFTPEHPGEFEFFCHVDGHAKKGMKGVLVVTP